MIINKKHDRLQNTGLDIEGLNRIFQKVNLP